MAIMAANIGLQWRPDCESMGDRVMPIHDWTCVPSGLFHHFHQSWSIRIVDALNAGLLPAGIAALVEQRSGPREADVLAIEARTRWPRLDPEFGGVATKEPPATRMVQRSNQEIYAGRANRIVLRHHLGRILAVIEILSPGNKDTRAALHDFVDKTVEFLREGIHVLVIDLFPPTPRDPQGIHKVVWDEIGEGPFAFPPGKDRTLVSYESGDERTAYVEPLAVGDELPDMPLFLSSRLRLHVPVPLESTYQATWSVTPEELRQAVETGILPEPDAD
jgi:hypothetical protein